MSRKLQFNSNQLALPLNNAGASALSVDGRERIFWFLVSVSVCSLGIYFYAINATAHHIAARQNLEKQVAQMAAGLGSLEFAQIELKNSVTIETAREYGFAEVKEPLYVTRDKAALTLNTAKR